MSGNTKATTEPTPAQEAPLSRDAIRDKIFGAKPREEVIDFFGTQIAVRQPLMGEILQAQEDLQAAGADRKLAAVQMLLHYAYIPGTSQKVFEEADSEILMQLPYGADMQNFQAKINELQGTDIKSLMKKVEDDTKSNKE